jgi:hypothetical protein
MRTLSHLWQAIEKIPGSAAIPAVWKAYCGPDLDLIAPLLRVTDEEGTFYPCPGPQMGYCPRRIVDHLDGEYVALCRDPHELCERVTLTRRDVLQQELDIAAFAKRIAGPLGVRSQPPVSREKGLWSVGVSDAQGTRGQPVFLALVPDTTRFVGIAQRLVINQDGPFVLVAPTKRHRTVEVLELLQARRSVFVALEERLWRAESGQLVAVDAKGEDGQPVAVTPIADRETAIKNFTKRYKCKVKDIHEAAGVHQTDYYRWLNGTSPDHYSTSMAIERILAEGFQPSRRRSRAVAE